MTICIYIIRNTIDGKIYVGKTKDHVRRFTTHRSDLKTKTCRKSTNRYLWNAAQKHGASAFAFEIVEQFDTLNEITIGERELFWMDHFDSCDDRFGYNLRRDTSTGMVQHAETLKLKSVNSMGDRNPNFGKNWTDEQKKQMSLHARFRHTLGVYDDQWRTKIGEKSTHFWSDLEKRNAMGRKVSEAKTKYQILQFSRSGVLIMKYDSVMDVVRLNPGYKWQNIYAACGGYKPTYMGFRWSKELINE
jgi:group I intron endonuclease